MTAVARSAQKTTGAPPLVARTGPCGAQTLGGVCPCEALTSPQDLAGYRTCTCGHTQYSHAVPTKGSAMSEINSSNPTSTSPTLEQALTWPMHDSTRAVLRFFAFDHLPSGKLRDASARCADLAVQVVGSTSDSAERTAGLRKLLEAKDCFVRAALAD